MPESLVQVTSGAGPKLHTFQRTIGANNVEDEFVIPGEYPLASYSVAVNANVAIATANSHLLQIMAGASNYVRIRRIRLYQTQLATALAFHTFDLVRLTTAGTGGTAYTPRPFDTSDAAAGATAMTLPTVKGTEGVVLDSISITLVAAATAGVNLIWEWTQLPGTKPIIIPAGATNGIAFKNTTSAAAGSVRLVVELVETTFAG